MRLLAAALAALLVLGVARVRPLSAQTLQGQVTDAASQRPIPGVVVTLLERDGTGALRAQTDSGGQYVLRARGPGSFRLQFQIPGYRMLFTELINLKRDEVRDYPVQLASAGALGLDTVVIAGVSAPRHLLDFYLRKTRGMGTFLTPQDINRLHPSAPTDLVRRLEGFDLGYDRFDPSKKLIKNKRWAGTGRACTPAIFLDGAYVGTADTYDIDSALWVDKLDAVESYSGSARVPIEFNATGSECGVIAIWTKR